eukprot:TRINITY_DN3983_c0_g2_i1.p1 TRINITY_DN3983_c0_g2~~TRINITY_DN3983_c0_g2_i1.p1  ORF type:complete len:582 (+),score=234.43 TRINITY_DN3983_c0_g2_i1:131-1747(+)
MGRELVIGHVFKSLNLKNGDNYRGWVTDEKKPRRHGGGTCKSKNGDKYVGGWRHDMRFGHGRLDRKNGDRYEGGWGNDAMDGFGEYRYAADHSTYRGEFREGARHGRGLQTFEDGTTYDGQWVDDRKQGRGVLQRRGGDLVYGEWEDDDMSRKLEEWEIAEFLGKAVEPQEEYEYVYAYDDGPSGDAAAESKADARSCTSLFGWDAIATFFGATATPSGSRKKRRQKKKGIRQGKLVDARETASGEQPKRRVGVSAETGGASDDDGDAPAVVHSKTEQQRTRIESILRENILFKACGEEQLAECIDAMFEVRKGPGAEIIVQGEEGDNFYLVDAGEADVFVNDNEGKPVNVATIQPGGFFGELSLMYSQPRTATVKGRTDCTLWALDRRTFRRILVNAQSSKAKLYESFLDKIEMLDALTAKEKAELADALEQRTWQDGEYVIRQGEKGDSFFIIERGEARVTKSKKPGKGKEKDITTLARGAYFGELALINDAPRAASVIAKGQLKTLSLDRECFTRLLGPVESVLKNAMDKYNESK